MQGRMQGRMSERRHRRRRSAVRRLMAIGRTARWAVGQRPSQVQLGGPPAQGHRRYSPSVEGCRRRRNSPLKAARQLLVEVRETRPEALQTDQTAPPLLLACTRERLAWCRPLLSRFLLSFAAGARPAGTLPDRRPSTAQSSCAHALRVSPFSVFPLARATSPPPLLFLRLQAPRERACVCFFPVYSLIVGARGHRAAAGLFPTRIVAP